MTESQPRSSSQTGSKSITDILLDLRKDAIETHRKSVGEGDELVGFLKGTIRRIESTQKRIILLNTVFFFFGLAVIGSAIYVALFTKAGGEVWGSMMGVGGLTSLLSMFYTAPLDKITRSVRDLIQLETAFLGYIRVVGAADSAFQWQYIEKMGGQASFNIADVAEATRGSIKDMMECTMALVDQYTSIDSPSKIKELSEKLVEIKKEVDSRLKKLERTQP